MSAHDATAVPARAGSSSCLACFVNRAVGMTRPLSSSLESTHLPSVRRTRDMSRDTSRTLASLVASLALSVSALGCGDDVEPEVPPDAPPPPRVVLYLAFEGITLHPGSPSEASTDTTSIVDAELTLPPYLDGHADRQGRIDAIVAEVVARVAPFDVEVVTRRPAAPPYLQIVFTGNSSLLGAPPGIGGMAPFDCDRDQPTSIGFQFSSGTADDRYGPRAHANWTLTMLGSAHRVPFTRVRNDCMCWIGPECNNADEVVCQIGGPGTPVATDYACEGTPATIDERALLEAALGVRP